MRAARRLAACVAAALLAGCAAGPDYQRPPVEMPAAWRLEPPWHLARPDDAADKGPWWQRFGDDTLDRLQRQLLGANPSLAVAAARLAQARSVLASAQAAALPQVGLGERATRQKTSANRPQSYYNVPVFSTVQNELTLQMAVAWEADVAGRIARSVESAQASSDQAAADLGNTRLLLTSDLAAAYFNLRAIDAEIDVLERSIALQQRALALVEAKRELGAASAVEPAQQQALIDATRVQLDLVRRARGPFEHAIATLAGVPAPSFVLAPDLHLPAPPAIPLGLPSDLLQRRPDIASAERAMAAANAQIGVAAAAVYPSVMLGGAYGLDSRTATTLFDASSLLWSLGVAATETLFDGGRIQANIDAARAGYDATVASYRRTVLGAMQEVEDGITGIAALGRAQAQAQLAVASARKLLDLVSARYDGGAAPYSDVITAQLSLLSAERQATQLQGQQLVTSVFLIKALGGDWAGEAVRTSAR